MWICPECTRSDCLTVTVLTTANLRQTDFEHFETEVDGDHEWDCDSTMSCYSCGNVGTAGQFECNLEIQPTNPEGPLFNTSRPVYTRRQRDGE